MKRSEGWNWARVELFRHQHGELPKQDESETRQVDDDVAYLKAAVAVMEGKVQTYSASTMLSIVPELLRDRELRTAAECAKTAEDHAKGCGSVNERRTACEEIAAAIRARFAVPERGPEEK